MAVFEKRPSVAVRAERVTKLFFKSSDWLCVKCQGLYPRGRLLPRQVRLTEELNWLRAEVGEGRLDGMRHSEFLKKRSRVRDLARDLGSTRAKASPRFRPFIWAEWRPEKVEKVKNVDATPRKARAVLPWAS